jgi:hypothetical protein
MSTLHTLYADTKAININYFYSHYINVHGRLESFVKACLTLLKEHGAYLREQSHCSYHKNTGIKLNMEKKYQHVCVRWALWMSPNIHIMHTMIKYSGYMLGDKLVLLALIYLLYEKVI